MENVDEILFSHTTEIAEHGQQIKTLFEQQKEIRELAKSTNNLALSVEKLAEQFKNIDGRLGAIENDKRYKINMIWASLATGVIGAVVAFLMATLLG
ncbi:MAG: hypothetical protein R2876_05870 [Eubacteriales bacterium]